MVFVSYAFVYVYSNWIYHLCDMDNADMKMASLPYGCDNASQSDKALC